MNRLELTVTGMSCTGCEQLAAALGRLDGVAKVDADHRAGTVALEYDADATDEATIAGRLNDAGYDIVASGSHR